MQKAFNGTTNSSQWFVYAPNKFSSSFNMSSTVEKWQQMQKQEEKADVSSSSDSSCEYDVPKECLTSSDSCCIDEHGAGVVDHCDAISNNSAGFDSGRRRGLQKKFLSDVENKNAMSQ